MIWPWQAEEIGRRLAAASDGISATIEPTAAAGRKRPPPRRRE
jgi:hypothetical protein